MINVEDEKRKKVRDLLADPAMTRKEHAQYMPLLAPLLDADIAPNRYTIRLQAEERQEMLLGLCVQLLRAKCKMHPNGVVLLLDNAQWIDEVSWGLITKLREAISPGADAPADAGTAADLGRTRGAYSTRLVEGQGMPLLIVACARSEARGGKQRDLSASTGHAQSLPQARRTSHRAGAAKQAQRQLRRQLEEHSPESLVLLSPLHAADLQDMAMRLLGAETIPPQLSTFLLNKSEGNPFYCIEIMGFLQRKGFVRVTADRGHVEVLKGGSEMERDFNNQFESMGVHRLIIAQVESLPGRTPQEKANLEQVLKSASALGESFSSRHVRELHAHLGLEPGASQVDANLGRLRELQQLEFHGEQLLYSFRSSLMRDVIYTSMTYENRKALHTAAADVLLQSSSHAAQHQGAKHAAKHLAAYYHLRQAENEPRVLGLTTDAAQQALAGTNWRDAIDVLEQGLDALGGEGSESAEGQCPEMEAAIEGLPPGTKVRWLEMRGEALLGVQLTEQAYASFQQAFEAGMAECGIELAPAERRGSPAGRGPAKKGHSLLGQGALLGQGLAKIMRDHARLVKRRSKGEDGGLAEEQVPGARSGLRAHTALCRALLEAVAADAADARSAVARFDMWKVGEHLRPSLAAAAGLSLCAEKLLTQAYGVLYLSLQLHGDGLDAAAVRAARPQLEQLTSGLQVYLSSGGSPHSAHCANSPRRRQGGRQQHSSPNVASPKRLSRPCSAPTSPATPASSSSPDSAVASQRRDGVAAAALQTLELSTANVQAVVCLALGLCPGVAAAESAASLKRASELAMEAEDPGLTGICEHFSALL